MSGSLSRERESLRVQDSTVVVVVKVVSFFSKNRMIYINRTKMNKKSFSGSNKPCSFICFYNCLFLSLDITTTSGESIVDPLTNGKCNGSTGTA